MAKHTTFVVDAHKSIMGRRAPAHEHRNAWSSGLLLGNPANFLAFSKVRPTGDL